VTKASWASLALAILVACQPHSTTSIRGEVKGKNGPEAGVWVVAETNDLKTGLTKIVVTDEQGRFLIPDLPAASYQVWVRGYGLKDSDPTRAKPGDILSLTANQAESPREAAQVYPADYWYAMVEPPPATEFPGTGPTGNGISPSMTTREAWIDAMKQQCQLCHQLGTKRTRENTHLATGFKDLEAVWKFRLAMPPMEPHARLMGKERAVKMYADWTRRVEAGEAPSAPPRPQGIERNLVVTMWNWGDTTTAMVHDETTVDKRNVLMNPNGKLYGVAQLDGQLLVTDPLKNVSTSLPVPMREDSSGPGVQMKSADKRITEQSGYNASRIESANNHNPMMDGKGRVWMTSSIRHPFRNPDWCGAGSALSWAKYFPLGYSTRQASYYDPSTGHFKLVDTCFTTHHLQFGADSNETLWLSGDREVIGWIDTKKLDLTGDEQASQGWCPTVLDTNGDGVITQPWNEPGQKIDPRRDTRIDGRHRIGESVVNEFTADFYYGIIPNPADGSVWVARPGPTPGALIRMERGSNPPKTCKSEVYEPPFNDGSTPRKDWGYGPRGIDISSTGVIWTALSGSSHLASFDRTKCKVTTGPTATGQHCKEGWTLYPAPGPKMKGVESAGGADWHYYVWVDQFNTLGLGKDVPIADGTGSDALLALDPKTGTWTTLRVPYPLGFYTRGLDGRVDDPKAGWKGTALFANYGGYPITHQERSKLDKTNHSRIVKFQLRPNPPWPNRPARRIR
jgi:hypothetical protein